MTTLDYIRISIAHLFLFLTTASTATAAAAAAAAAACWTPNHIKQPPTYTPCNSTAEFSMCCATWDSCDTATGLCFNQAYQLWWRESCTDPTWQSDACVKLFLDDSIDDISLTKCADGSWCPFSNASSIQCCENAAGVFLNGTSVKDLQEISAIDTHASDLASSSSSTSSASASASTSSPPAHSSSLGAASIAGISVGGAAIVVAGVVVGACLLRRRRDAYYSRANQIQASHAGRISGMIASDRSAEPVEMPAEMPMGEMKGEGRKGVVYELSC